MADTYESVFESFSFRADLAFTGHYCNSDHAFIEHDSGFIHFVRSGRAEVVTPGAAARLVDTPSLIFFPRPHTHSLRSVDPDGVDLVCARTNFDARANNPLAACLPDMLVIELKRIPSIRSVLQLFFSEAASTGFGRKKIAENLCVVLLIYMTRHLIEQGAIKTGILNAVGDKRLSKALELIHRRYADRLTLEELAKNVGMSRSRFAEHFRRVVGQSPFEYLAHYRIGIAQKMLLSNRPVKHIAAEVGYESTSAFLRKFKEIVGNPPGAWSRLAGEGSIRSSN